MPLVETIVGGIFFAFILGYIAQRLKMPPLIGYLLAGVLVGPYTGGFKSDLDLSQQLAELGVILLMFGVGLHFSVKDLLSVKFVAIPGAILQIIASTILGTLLGFVIGWPMGASLLLGLALSCASTVVLMAALSRWHLVDTTRGRIATGWLIVEDLVMVFVLVLIPPIAPILVGSSALDLSQIGNLIGTTAVKVIAFVAIMMFFGRLIIPWILKRVLRTGNPELFRLGVIAIALACAILANYLFGVSFALGAFFAGAIINETEMRQSADEGTLSLRDFYTILFFVGVGMLFNPGIILSHPLLLLATLAIVIFGNSMVSFGIVRLLGYPKSFALTIGVGLAQIGEFSFMIASLGVTYEIFGSLARDIILATAILSIVINPFLFMWLNRYQQKNAEALESEAAKSAEETPEVAAKEEASSDDNLNGKPHAKIAAPIKPASIFFQDEDLVFAPEAKNHTVIIECGTLGRLILQNLKELGLTVYVQESGLDIANKLRIQQIPVAYGNPLSEGMLEAVFIKEALNLIITLPDPIETLEILSEAKRLNPKLNIIVFADTDDTYEKLVKAGATYVVRDSEVLATEAVKIIKNIEIPPQKEAPEDAEKEEPKQAAGGE